ncbi:ABC-2 transporter permease [Ruminococcus flavefaciens]|uniref:ABC-2 transporter permease n=1 Tax=Ruminococcus flavefaciens TaxID=1265 RepID=UPI0026EA169C|nr:ABC-2 transporter permease [Ruminococcus flavefaciens]MDD7517066.1 ABC-2 transporter permease [Ruminococcus flavefaciens]MDY5692153.1 ABC-2 transporter permease [Ruminococcus flavefaciens]
MKGLVYREIYLMRKALGTILIVFFLFLLMLSLFFISTYAGNLAKSEQSDQNLNAFYPMAYIYTGALAILGFSGANSVIYDDYKSRWRLYSYTLPVDEKKMAFSMLLFRAIMLGAGFLLALFGEVVLGIAAKKGVSVEHIKNLLLIAAFVPVSYLTIPLALKNKEMSKTVITLLLGGAVPVGAGIYGLVRFIIYSMKEAEIRYPGVEDDEALKMVIRPYIDKVMDIAVIAAPFVLVGSLVLSYHLTVRELKRRHY